MVAVDYLAENNYKYKPIKLKEKKKEFEEDDDTPSDSSSHFSSHWGSEHTENEAY